MKGKVDSTSAGRTACWASATSRMAPSSGSPVSRRDAVAATRSSRCSGDVRSRDPFGDAEPPLGDGARLVGADAGHAPDVLDGDGAADEGLAASETEHADAEEEREGHRELLGQSGHGERDGAERGIEKPVALPDADDGEEKAHRRGGHQEDRDEAGDRLLHRGPRAGSTDCRTDDLSVERLRSREDDAKPRMSREESRPREAPMDAVHDRLRCSVRKRREGRLRDRIRLARQRGLVRLHPGAAGQDAVRGKRLPGGDDGEVTGHELRGGDRPASGRLPTTVTGWRAGCSVLRSRPGCVDGGTRPSPPAAPARPGG